MNDRRRFREEIKYDNSKEIEKLGINRIDTVYNAQKTSLLAEKERPKRKIKNSIKLTLGALGLSASVLVGAKSISNYRQSRPISIEQAMDAGMSLKDIELDEDIYNRIIELKERLNNCENMSKEEIINLGSEIVSTELLTIKSKIAKAVNEKNPDSQKVFSSNISVKRSTVGKDYIYTVNIGDITYTSKDITGIFGEEKTISGEISNYIEDIIDLQDSIEEINNLDITNKLKNNVKKEYEPHIKVIEGMATGEIKIDDKNNMTVDYFTQKELGKYKNEKENENEEIR